MIQNLMLIDDDEDDREIFSSILEDAWPAISLSIATNGREALQKLQTSPNAPDLIFLDLNMPRLNGKQCLAELKKEAHLAHIPVIIYSTSSEKRDIEETSRLGAAHFLTKPNKFEELCRALSYVVSKDWTSH